MRYGTVAGAVHDLLALGPGVDVLTPTELRSELYAAACEIATSNADTPRVALR
jgi:hypothetical protein